ncbi:NUDIX hydrolase [Nocardia callitridis]|uniref:NUDIX hydrolase n=1 Tax=Nocardia callitridis TaxID=648753 RepID=UPI0031EC52BD
MDRHLIDAHVLLVDGDRLLLSQRGGTDEFAGRWHLPAGKLEAGESITVAAAREANEEIGVVIDPSDLRVVHVAHVTGSGQEARLGLFLHASRWSGEPSNREPQKCFAVTWFPLNEMPSNMIEYAALGVRAFLDGAVVSFSEHGW